MVLSDYICDKLLVVGDIAKGSHIDANGTNPCDSQSSNEAYVLATCNTSLPQNWTRGQNVGTFSVSSSYCQNRKYGIEKRSYANNYLFIQHQEMDW